MDVGTFPARVNVSPQKNIKSHIYVSAFPPTRMCKNQSVNLNAVVFTGQSASLNHLLKAFAVYII